MKDKKLKSFIDAIKDNDILQVSLYIDHIEDINITMQYDHKSYPNFRWSPLVLALHYGFYDIAHLLLDKGASAKLLCPISYLTYSANNVEQVRPLLDRLLALGADINEVSAVEPCFPPNPFLFAINKNKVDFAEFYLEHGADLSLKDEHNRTALTYATMRGNLPLMKKLIENGADPLIKDTLGQTLFSHIKTPNVDIIKLLMENGLDINSEEKFISTLLDGLIFSNDIEIAKFLFVTHKKTVHISIPTTVCTTAKTLGHKQLAKILEDYSNQEHLSNK